MKKLTSKDIKNNQYFCTICSKEFTPKVGTYGSFCSLSCSSKRGRESKIYAEYIKNPKKCEECSKIIEFKNRSNKFCSHSCSATFNNKGVVRNTHGNIASINTKIATFKIVTCKICNTESWQLKSYTRNTCSDKCHHELISLHTRGKTGGSTKQYIGYIDSTKKEIWLDSSWELKIANELDKNGVVWTRPKGFVLSNGRRYTPDFYLADYQIFLDPKAYRKGYLENVEKIKQFESESNTKCLIISNEQDLTWSYIKSHL